MGVREEGRAMKHSRRFSLWGLPLGPSSGASLWGLPWFENGSMKGTSECWDFVPLEA